MEKHWRSFPSQVCGYHHGSATHHRGSSQHDLPRRGEKRGSSFSGGTWLSLSNTKWDQSFPSHYLYSGTSSSYSSGLCYLSHQMSCHCLLIAYTPGSPKPPHTLTSLHLVYASLLILNSPTPPLTCVPPKATSPWIRYVISTHGSFTFTTSSMVRICRIPEKLKKAVWIVGKIRSSGGTLVRLESCIFCLLSDTEQVI